MTMPPRKIFSAELSMMKTGGGNLAAAPEPAPAAAAVSGVASKEILDAIQALRNDVKELRDEVNAAPKIPTDEENQILRIEIARMIKSLSKTKREIAQIRHPGVDQNDMDKATSELDTIVAATENATNRILETVESLNSEARKIADLVGDSEDVIPIIYRVHAGLDTILEACSFQDITGQRITRVVKTLAYVEERVRSVIEEWGAEAFLDLPVPEHLRIHASDDLVHGPAPENEGLSQDDIDALFD